jgi:hypothetical protein
MLSAEGGAGFNPTIAELQFTSQYVGNFTFSNIMIGDATAFFAAPASGDFNADGLINGDDLARWNEGYGVAGTASHWHGDANGDQLVDGADFLAWQRGVNAASATTSAAVPEPASFAIFLTALPAALAAVRRQRER